MSAPVIVRTQAELDAAVRDFGATECRIVIDSPKELELTFAPEGRLVARVDIAGEARVGDVYGEARVGDVYGEARVGSVSGEASVGSVYGKASVGDVYGEARVGSVSGEARVGDVYGEASVGYVSGEASVGDVYGEASVGDVYGEASVGDVYGEARVGSVYGEARVGSVYGEARVGSVYGEARVGSVSGEASVGSVYGKASVGDVYGEARVGSVSGEASVGYVYGEASVGNASGTPTIHMRGHATLTKAGPYVAVYVHSQTVTVNGGHIIDMTHVDETDVDTWAALHGAEITDGEVLLFKAVDADLVAGHRHVLTTYTIGETITAADWRADNACGGGLHASPNPYQARSYYRAATRMLVVAARVEDVRPIPSGSEPVKCKARAVRVLREVTLTGDPLPEAVAS